MRHVGAVSHLADHLFAWTTLLTNHIPTRHKAHKDDRGTKKKTLSLLRTGRLMAKTAILKQE